MMPPQLARAKRPKRSEPRPLVETLPTINVNDLPIPRDYNTYVADNISFRYPHINRMKINRFVVSFFHSDRVQIFRFKWIKTGLGSPRAVFICECGRPVISLYFRCTNLACRRCTNAIYASQVCPRDKRPCLQAQRMHMFLKLKTGMWKSTRQRLKTRITATARQELKSKRLAHHSIQIPSSNYCTRGAMHWR